MKKSGEKGLQVVLKDCSFSAKHNFNLLSMSRLLHKQGWERVHGDESLIRTENGKGEVIDFDIVVRTEKGAIYACKFVRTVEVAMASAERTIKVNINMAHVCWVIKMKTPCVTLQRNWDEFSHMVH
jgi:hypothetical protein